MPHSPDHRLHARLRLWLLAGPAAALLGCTVGPNFVRPAPRLPAQWASGPGAAHAPADTPKRESIVTGQPAQLTRWWDNFHDATLNALLGRAVASNLDLRTAVLHVEEASVQRDIAADANWPTLSANASYSLQQLSTNTPTGSLLTSVGNRLGAILPQGAKLSGVPNPYDQFQLGGSISWELDLFGRVRRQLEAANARLHASVAERNGVMVALLSRVAQSYIALRGAQARQAIAARSIRTDRQLLELARERRAAGLTTDLDVENAAAQLAATRARLPELGDQVTRDINRLSLLLARPPGALRARLAAAEPIPPVPPSVPVGLPAALVRRRPDIRAAEATLHAATARIGVAVAGLFPNLTLGGGGGLQAATVSKLVQWASRFASIGPTLTLPLFDRGAHAMVRLQSLRAREAAVAYARTVLTALHEVDDALAAYGADQDQRAWLGQAVQHGQAALALARQRYRSGLSSFIDVLDAERSLLQNQMALAASTTAVSTDLVTLYQALGGGWRRPPHPVAAAGPS